LTCARRAATPESVTLEARLRILLYGRLADAIDRQIEIDAPEGSTINQIRQQLALAYPQAADALARSRAVIGKDAVENSRSLAADQTIAFLPPVSGG
jgi:molybdopterin converting factor small subunit